MGYLDQVGSPADVKKLGREQAEKLADEIRQYLVSSVSLTGGHLGPNLGVVELTLAMHRVFNSPRDSFIFDTGHQSYVHKLLTGRTDFTSLRKKDGLSGYPARAESTHDIVENSHASTALSWADGIARANLLKGHNDRHAVAVIGDGALTGGMAWEALNNISESDDRRLIVIVNDNGRSYSPTIGGLARHLDTLRTTRQYEGMLSWGKRTLPRFGVPGQMMYDGLHGIKKGVKNIIRPQGWFEDLGIKYLGPIDGHDLNALEHAYTRAKAYGAPVLVHVITEKGRGYKPAEEDLADRFHAVGQIHPETGLPVAPARFGWTKVFADEIVSIGRRRSDVVGITAAMLQPVGLLPFSREFPERTYDVGIAEQHAATSAAGMAFAGLHPVVALYATFLNRAFDQVLMDVALHKAGVTFVLDRSGITGDDGASHNGMWDMALMRIVPGLRLAAPRDEATLRQALNEAVDINDAPTVVRYPKGAMGEPLPAIDQHQGVDVLARFGPEAPQAPTTGQQVPSVLMAAVGAMAPTVLEAAQKVAAQGNRVTVVAPTWVLPIPPGLIDLAKSADVVITVEDGLASGGIGALLAEHVTATGSSVRVHPLGLPPAFLDHASRAQIIEATGLTDQAIADRTVQALADQLA
ncbi:1-deoxy-D-xylulose-5-phosphate synthase [Jonesia quinghaiensis]|uniref:1-deoxy-D-xylulose-5-phosphate synthase n=1 Tax=Jonesia quinghaiensis TaxID=262806 RepID=UPI000491EAB9|nr:1-deoxy-D-xylulose-5-phosphate synthase [Jonesia quinghaiensis]